MARPFIYKGHYHELSHNISSFYEMRARGVSTFAVSASKRRRRERGRRDVVGFGLEALWVEVLVDTRSVTVSFARVA